MKNGFKSILPIALTFTQAACMDPCGNKMLSDAISPDGGRRAVVFERDCGATTGFSVQVSVLDAKEPLPRSAGNAFIADDNHGTAGYVGVSVRWSDSDHLIVSYPTSARVFQKLSLVKTVIVSYETYRHR